MLLINKIFLVTRQLIFYQMAEKIFSSTSVRKSKLNANSHSIATTIIPFSCSFLIFIIKEKN